MNSLTPRSLAALRRGDERVAASRARGARHRDEVSEHWIYRCYDAEDRLLYIGCTMDVEGRIQAHRASWGNPASAYLILRMARYEAEGPFVGRIAGRNAEREAIAAEAPLLNVHHNKGRGLERVPVEPLTPVELADASAKIHGLFSSWGATA